MKVINESDKYVSFKKGSLIGHAESADLVPDAMVNCDINRCVTQPQGFAEQNVNEAQELPEHLKKCMRIIFRNFHQKKNNSSKVS